MSLFKSTKKGMRCEENQDGSLTCKPYKVENNEKLATGSEVTVQVDPQTCKPIFLGGIDMIEDDEKSISRAVKRRVEACKRGF